MIVWLQVVVVVVVQAALQDCVKFVMIMHQVFITAYGHVRVVRLSSNEVFKVRLTMCVQQLTAAPLINIDVKVARHVDYVNVMKLV